MSQYRPAGCKILVEAEIVESKTAGGIIIPEMSKEAEQTRVIRGTILAIGPEASVYYSTPGEAGDQAKVGDRIIFAKYGGMYIKSEDGRDLRFINDEDIVAKIE